MFFPQDPFSELVVHFIGYFQVAVEDMRVRLELQQIERENTPAELNPTLDQIPVDIQQSYALGTFLPGVRYLPPDWVIRGDAPVEAIHVDLRLPPIQIELNSVTYSVPQFFHHAETEPLPYLGPQPGSLIAVISQEITLNDDDLFSMESLDEPIHFDSGAATAIALMQAAGLDLLGPIATEMGMESYGDAGRLIEVVQDVLLQNGSAQPFEVGEVENLEGIYVNGERMDVAPELDDALPMHLRPSEDDDAEGWVKVDGTDTAQLEIVGSDHGGSVTFNAGGNYLVNDVAVLNAGVASAHYVVTGDFHQFDAIIQINIFADHDSVVDGFALSQAPGITSAVNLASFTQETRDVGGAAEANPGVMPSNWQVTVITGDIVFIEWMKQLTLVSDQDIGVLTASGSSVTVTSGENLANNHIAIENIGLYYDLIMVGGNVYDVNIIVQTNILYDNDTISALGLEQVETLSGTLNTSGNLLWNQAAIDNVGAVDVEGEVSEQYGAAMRSLDAGDYSMPEGLGTDPALEGIAMPRVLYVTGNIYDLRYVEQTNVLSDADLVALAQPKAGGSISDTTFEIDTGSNALVNIATIKDIDTFGETIQVGGNHYSDAILIQAEILTGDGNGNPDALVTEVVAFLDTTDDLTLPGDFAITDGLHHDAPPVDVMQTVLA